MQGNYISLVLPKIQCLSLLIYQRLLSPRHIRIFLLEIYGCTLAMYHCSYLISWQTQAHPHFPLSCTLLQTTNRRNICLLLENEARDKDCVKWGRLRQILLFGAYPGDSQPSRASWAKRESTATLVIRGQLKDDFSSYANTHQILKRLHMAWKLRYLSTAAYVCFPDSLFCSIPVELDFIPMLS